MDEGQRVLLLANRFEVRGSSLYTLRLAHELARLGVSPTIVTPLAGSPANGTPTREFRHLHVPLWGHVVRRLAANHIEDEIHPRLVHIQARSMLPVGIWLAKRLSIPYVATVHDYLGPRERFPHDPAHCAGIIAVSESVRESLLESAGLPEHLVRVIHTGVDIVPIDSREVLADDHAPVIGAAAPLIESKGFPFFLGAADKVLETHRNVHFLVAGAGPEEPNLRRLARELKITERLTFITGLHEFTTALTAMDIFCLPALSQGLGTVMLEAMALGKPVIATGVGGVFSAIRDHETGLVVPPADSSALARKMIELLDDPKRARSIGNAGRDLVHERFHIAETAKLTIEEYARAIGTGEDDAAAHTR